MTTTSQLLATKTVDSILTELLAAAAARSLPVTAWQVAGVARTLLYTDATVLADVYVLRASLARSAFLDEAEGDWLTLLGASVFDTDRTLSTYSAGYVRLTASAAAGPYSITEGGLLVSDGARRWRSTNTTTLTLAAGGTLDVPVQAESPGTAYNVANGAITTLISPALAGVSVSNPAYGATGTWITSSGADEESDASLRTRCRSRWGTLGRGANDAAYLYWARTGHSAEAQVTRAQVVWGPGDGTLTVYLASASGLVSPTVVSVVQAWIDGNTPGTDAPTVTSVGVVGINLVATVTVAAANDSAANRALATEALAAYVAGLDIGEDVDLGRLYACFYEAAGVVDVDISYPTGDVSVNNGQVAALTLFLTWTAV